MKNNALSILAIFLSIVALADSWLGFIPEKNGAEEPVLVFNSGLFENSVKRHVFKDGILSEKRSQDSLSGLYLAANQEIDGISGKSPVYAYGAYLGSNQKDITMEVLKRLGVEPSEEPLYKNKKIDRESEDISRLMLEVESIKEKIKLNEVLP